ncbi:GGDEF domain-containing protein [Lacticaseibacillus zhaodongensis]|uniref:GGDEF domain-containing protein n=1 Tax=Lacticaseibacillus zhaodongensis TaxID=2668065 RepID=UPI0012D357A4|nr:GGDEF domain-containing protein [Lacticaseibacillus zhaodongensis]
MFNWGIWFIETVIATFFISGFVVIYNRADVTLRNVYFANTKNGTMWASMTLTLFVFVMVGFCALAKYLNPVNASAYQNWALYVLFIPLMDRNVQPLSFWARTGGIVVLWILNSNVHDPFFAVSLISVLLLQAVTWHWRREASNSWFLHMGIAIWAASAFWLTQTQLTLVTIGMAIVMFSLMNVFTLMYWSAERITDLEHKRLVKQVNQDTLTHVGSLFAFKEDMTTQIELARRLGEPLTLAMFDIDFFKHVNDNFGHAAGNFVLSEVARQVNELLEQTSPYSFDFYRTGGEEFNIIFENAEVSVITPIAAQILTMIRKQNFVYEGHAIKVTLSMGITSLCQNDTGLEDVYERADAQLYEAKRNGRDQVRTTNVLSA